MQEGMAGGKGTADINHMVSSLCFSLWKRSTGIQRWWL